MLNSESTQSLGRAVNGPSKQRESFSAQAMDVVSTLWRQCVLSEMKNASTVSRLTPTIFGFFARVVVISLPVGSSLLKLNILYF